MPNGDLCWDSEAGRGWRMMVGVVRSGDLRGEAGLWRFRGLGGKQVAWTEGGKGSCGRVGSWRRPREVGDGGSWKIRDEDWEASEIMSDGECESD